MEIDDDDVVAEEEQVSVVVTVAVHTPNDTLRQRKFYDLICLPLFSVNEATCSQ